MKLRLLAALAVISLFYVSIALAGNIEPEPPAQAGQADAAGDAGGPGAGARWLNV